MVQSNISNQVVFGDESTYGTLSSAFTLLMGAVDTFSWNESESTEPIGSLGSGSLPLKNEPGLYLVTGTLVTRPTKSSLPVLLDYFFGDRTDVDDYTIVNDDTTIKSISVKAQHTATDTVQITGLVFTNLSIDMAKDGIMSLSMDYIAKKLITATETVTYTQPTDACFTWLDISGTYGGNAFKGNSVVMTADWNIDANDGRGLETVGAGERRLIQRVVKNNLTLGGNFDVVIENTNEIGYEDEKTDQTLIVTVSRGTDNAHTFTYTGTQLDNKNFEATHENGVKNFTADIVGGLTVSMAGDL